MRRQQSWPVALIIVILTLSLTPAARADGPDNCAPGAESSGTCPADSPPSPIEMRALNAAIAAQPTPPVTPIEVDEEALFNRNYQRVLQEVTIYDAPNGNPVGALAPGFNFFTTIDYVEGWAEVNYGQWVQAEHLGSANVSRFTGVLIDGPLVHPFAWMLLNTRPSRHPGAAPVESDPVLTRYTLVSIFAAVEVDDWAWYLVGPDQWVHQTRLGKVNPVARPEGVEGRWVAVDLYEQTLVAYEDDGMVFATLVSSGLADWETNEGLFQIWARHERTPMSGAEGLPDFYYLEEVPWTMYFDNDISLHGTYWHDGFGYRHSHGCVNLSIADAHWLFQWTAEGYEDAYVYVYSTGEYR